MNPPSALTRLARFPAMIAVGITAMITLSCSDDPEERVTQSSADDAFSLTLAADKNWLRPGDSLPIRVVLESKTGVLAETRSGRIHFIGNLGRIDVDYLDFVLTGRSDSLATQFDTEFSDWVTFASFSSSSEEEQGEVHALYEDLQVTLKIRFVHAK